MKPICGTLAFCLSLLLAVVCLWWGVANAWGAAAEPNLNEKFIYHKAQMLIVDGGTDLKKLNDAIEARGEAPIDLKSNDHTFGLARWFSADLQQRTISRREETAIIQFITASASVIIAILIWLARPRAASST